MGMNWRQLVLVVLVAAIVGGASGFVGDQVSVRWFEGGVFQTIIPSPSGSLDNRIKRLEEREDRELQEWSDCLARSRPPEVQVMGLCGKSVNSPGRVGVFRRMSLFCQPGIGGG